MFIFLALIVTLIATFYWWRKSAFDFWKNKGVPSLEVTFPVGTLGTKKHIAYNLLDIYNEWKDRTKFVGGFIFVKPHLIVLDLDLVRQVMVKDFNHFGTHGNYVNEADDPLSAHLFSLDGARWRSLRTKLTPTFTSGKMRAMCPIVTDIGQRFKDLMDKLVDSGGNEVDMREMFARFTTDVIGTCAFGLECNSLKDPDAEFRKYGMKVFSEPRQPQVIQFAMGSFPNLARKLHLKFTPDDVEKFFLKVVNDTFEHRIKNNIKRDDFVDLLITLRNENKSNSLEDLHMDGMSMNEIAAQCFVFFLAGFETSSTASSFTIYELSRNQDIQDKLRNHIREVLKKHEGKLTYDALKDMTYLEQCINEGLRMYPPLPMLMRGVTLDYKLPETNVILPKGIQVFIPVYAFHHDPANYPSPEQYNPDRFSPEEVAKRHPFAFLPFGEGPRNCIGERFGMMQAKIGLAYLIGNYRFKLNSKTKPLKFKKKSFILNAEGGLYFDVEKV